MSDEQAIRFKLPPIPGAVDDPNYLPPDDPVEAEKREEAQAVLDPVERLKQSGDTSTLTVGEMKARDEDNLKLVLDSCRQRGFNTPVGAVKASVEYLFSSCEKFGIPVRKATPRQLADVGRFRSLPELLMHVFRDDFVKNDVRLEVREVQRYTPLEQWKAGCYVYHGNEIAYFISNPRRHDLAGGNGRIIVPGENRKWWIVTNAPG